MSAAYSNRPSTKLSSLASVLEVFQVGYPRVIHFRDAEYAVRTDHGPGPGLPYEQWAELVARTSGMVGKALEETHPLSQEGIQPYIDYYTQFKQDYPQKLVLVHHNDVALNPVPDGALANFWAGHWLYFEGVTLTQPVNVTDTVLHVEDISFQERGGFRDDLNYRNTNGDDIVIARMGADGKPDWNRAEHAAITEVDYEYNTITVQRGAYGSEALEWEAGDYVAPHVRFPNMNTPLRWWYNLSTEAPVDPQGRQGMDAFVEDLVSHFGPGGVLEIVDGIQFDVARWEVCCGASPDIDADGDGVADGGYFDEVNTYGVGKLEFYKRLKLALPDKLILADSWIESNNQRGFHILHGMESEGWPHQRDTEFELWSVGLNRHLFWNANSAWPSVSYISHQYDGFSTPPPGDPFPDEMLTTQRLMSAGAVFTDSVLTVRYIGSEYSPAFGGLYDELRKGVGEEPNWLGSPMGPAEHLASQTADLLGGDGQAWPQGFVDTFASSDATLTRVDSPTPHLMVTPDPQSGPYRERGASFVLPGIQNTENDLFVAVSVRAEPTQEYPDTIGRKFGISAINQTTDETRSSFTWMNQTSFEATFYFRDIGPGSIDLLFGQSALPFDPGPNDTEGDQPYYVESLTVHAAADGMYREFEGGVVFANPSTSNYTFDVSQLFPGIELRRLDGDVSPDANTGELVGGQLTIGPKDALFVEKVVTYQGVASLIDSYHEMKALTRPQRRKLLTHLSIAQRMDDQDERTQAEQFLDRFSAVASEINDHSVRESLLSAAQKLRAEL